MNDIHERDEQMILFLKIGGLTHDLENDEELAQIFKNEDISGMVNALKPYGLDRKDLQKFISVLERFPFMTWYKGYLDKVIQNFDES